MLFTFVQCTNFAYTDCEGGSPRYNITANQLYKACISYHSQCDVVFTVEVHVPCPLGDFHSTSQADHGLVHALPPVHLWLQPVFHH